MCRFAQRVKASLFDALTFYCNINRGEPDNRKAMRLISNVKSPFSKWRVPKKRRRILPAEGLGVFPRTKISPKIGGLRGLKIAFSVL
jgi:hypothetical protein